MDLLPYFEALEASGPGVVIKESLWLFPVIECVHLLALALLGGAVLITDLRLLNLGLKDQPPVDLERRLHPWLLLALASLVLTGVPMFLSEAVKCFYSPPFWYKMGLLAVAILFTLTLRRRLVAAGSRPGALLSIGLWFGVAFAGRWIAFY
ncbi:MAG: hypothetical protein FJW30_15785 [Acidobacteria bacterium]|nr:hypothetical protein [Acidobacteriota bacterium]